MGIKLSLTPKATLIEAGVYIARVCGIVDLGIQRREYNGEVKPSQQQLLFSFELPTEMLKDKEGNDVPRRMSKKFNVSMHELSALTPLLKAIDPDGTKLEKSVEALLTSPCQLTVEHYTNKKNEQAAAIGAITQVMKGMEVPELFVEPTSFSLDDPDMDQWNGFADWLKDKVREAENFAQSPLAELDVVKEQS